MWPISVFLLLWPVWSIDSKYISPKNGRWIVAFCRWQCFVLCKWDWGQLIPLINESWWWAFKGCLISTHPLARWGLRFNQISYKVNSSKQWISLGYVIGQGRPSIIMWENHLQTLWKVFTWDFFVLHRQQNSGVGFSFLTVLYFFDILLLLILSSCSVSEYFWTF